MIKITKDQLRIVYNFKIFYYWIALFCIVSLLNCNANNLIKIEDDIQAMKLELDDIKDKLEIKVEEDELYNIKQLIEDNSKRCIVYNKDSI